MTGHQHCRPIFNYDNRAESAAIAAHFERVAGGRGVQCSSTGWHVLRCADGVCVELASCTPATRRGAGALVRSYWRAAVVRRRLRARAVARLAEVAAQQAVIACFLQGGVQGCFSLEKIASGIFDSLPRRPGLLKVSFFLKDCLCQNLGTRFVLCSKMFWVMPCLVNSFLCQ